MTLRASRGQGKPCPYENHNTCAEAHRLKPVPHSRQAAELRKKREALRYEGKTAGLKAGATGRSPSTPQNALRSG